MGGKPRVPLPPLPGEKINVSGMLLRVHSVGENCGIWAHPVDQPPTLGNLVFVGKRFVGDI
jgi:hypothetical protein